MVVKLLYDHKPFGFHSPSLTDWLTDWRTDEQAWLQGDTMATIGGPPIKLYRTPGVFIQFIFIAPLAFYDRCNISLFLFSPWPPSPRVRVVWVPPAKYPRAKPALLLRFSGGPVSHPSGAQLLRYQLLKMILFTLYYQQCVAGAWLRRFPFPLGGSLTLLSGCCIVVGVGKKGGGVIRSRFLYL